MIDTAPSEWTGQPTKTDHVLMVGVPGPDSPGKYVLVVYRPVPFGYGATVFTVDQVDIEPLGEHLPPIVRATRGDALVTQFPSTFDYILLARDLTEIVPKEIFLKKYASDPRKQQVEDDELPEDKSAHGYI